MKIEVQSLTSYEVGDDGRRVDLGLVDSVGNTVQLNLDVDQLGTLAMTLPSLIEVALKRRYRDASLRYCHTVGSYIVEQASDSKSLIITLKTNDGFGASFTVSRDQANIISEALALGACEPAKTAAHYDISGWA